MSAALLERDIARARLPQRGIGVSQAQRRSRDGIMSLRVIAGSARGMKLKPVPGDATRPVMDRVKEALFNIIGSRVRGANFLDLYAGTGSVGIEALSRGAAYAHFNDRDQRAIATIRRNLAHTSLSANARATRRNALDLIARRPDRRYHFIYVAPPQYKRLWLLTLETLDAKAAWQSRDTQVIAQIDPSEYEDRRFDHLAEMDQRRYGSTMLLFYRFLTDGEDGAGEPAEA